VPAPQAPSTRAFGVWLATRGPAVRASLALAFVGTVAGVIAAVSARSKPYADAIPPVTSAALSWGTGVMVAFGASLRAAHRDRDDGVLALLRARGVGASGYVVARAGGLAIMLAGTLGASVLCVAIAATLGSATPLATARAGAGAVAYALAFAATIAPLALATVGGRSRGLGYLALLLVLALPEALAPWTRQLLPAGWRELTSIPAALDAVRHGVTRPDALAHAARALVGLAVVIVASLIVVRGRVARISAEATA
jgi:hypothetical protein